MTVVDFERVALSGMQRIKGATACRVDVGLAVVTAACKLDGKPHEVSHAYRGDDQRELAFTQVIRAIEQTGRARRMDGLMQPKRRRK